MRKLKATYAKSQVSKAPSLPFDKDALERAYADLREAKEVVDKLREKLQGLQGDDKISLKLKSLGTTPMGLDEEVLISPVGKRRK